MRKGFYIKCKQTDKVVVDGIENMRGAMALAQIYNYQDEDKKFNYIVIYNF